MSTISTADILEQGVLPYQELTEVASRDVIRANAKYTNTEIYRVPLSRIRIREGFNVRKKPEWMSDEQWWIELKIPELMMSMAHNGMEEPMKGDFTPDGKIFFVTDGHRRYLAHLGLNNEGYERFIDEKSGDYMIDVKRNPAGFTEYKRMKQMFTSQDNLQLTPLQLGELFVRLSADGQADENGEQVTHESIAEMWGRSRQWVDNMVSLTKLPVEIRKKVELGEMNPTAALHWLNTSRKEEKKERSKKDKPEREEDAPGDLKDKSEGGGGDNFHEMRVDEAAGLGPDAKPDLHGRPPGHPDYGKVNYDNTSVHDQEAEANKATDPKFKDPHRKIDGDDALGEVDFKKEKTEAEMELNEVKKMLDKITVKMDSLPANMGQFKDDVQRLCVICVKKIAFAQDIIKKAADKR